MTAPRSVGLGERAQPWPAQPETALLFTAAVRELLPRDGSGRYRHGA